MNHRFTSVSLSPTNDFFHCLLDNIDKKLANSFDILDENESNNNLSIQFENLNQLKKQIIYQGIQTAQAMIEPLIEIIAKKMWKPRI